MDHEKDAQDCAREWAGVSIRLASAIGRAAGAGPEERGLPDTHFSLAVCHEIQSRADRF